MAFLGSILRILLFTIVNKHMLTFVSVMKTPTEIEELYGAIKVPNFNHRYTPPEAIETFLTRLKSQGIFKTIGASVQGREIGYVEFGTGDFKILAWSQMHGDESTTTRALLDLYSFLNQTKYQSEFVQAILATYRLRIIFQLNPDGAYAYTRENALGYDLNRDAITQNQQESKLLFHIISEFAPDLCLNCHDQRSLYSLDKTINPPQISFLSPAADDQLTHTPARLSAMKYIISATRVLQNAGFNKIGRYDESYCPNCFGDHLQSKGIPTVLIESGHVPDDPQREKSRYVVFTALLGILKHHLKLENSDIDPVNDYFKIPENQNLLRDFVLRNVLYQGNIVDIGLQNRYVFKEGVLNLQTYVHDIVPPGTILGYKNQDLKTEEILINSHENDFENKIIVSIMLKKSGLLIKI